MDAPGRRRVLQQLDGRTDGTGRKIAATVGANAFELGLHAIGAEGAFIGADARILAIGRKIAIATFAVGTKLQHDQILQIENQS